MTLLDRRLHALREDLADARLRGRVTAPRFSEGQVREVTAAAAPVRRRPAADAALDTEALRGERVRVFDEDAGWCWVQLETDGYVGYMPGDMLSAPGREPTHRVAALATFLYPAADMKRPPLQRLTFGALLALEGEEGGFAAVSGGGFVWRAHVRPVAVHDPDFVAVAERFISVPYLWGGRTADGLDCSGLVQTALAASGRTAPRDSDMQEALGAALDPKDLAAFRRGDLVFWKGHVGIMLDAGRLLHANGHHMLTVIEPLAQAVERIAATGLPVTAARRLEE